jgi:hypothetical protein
VQIVIEKQRKLKSCELKKYVLYICSALKEISESLSFGFVSVVITITPHNKVSDFNSTTVCYLL